MPAKKHRNDATGPEPEEAESNTHNLPDGQPMPDDQAESEGEKQAREVERGFDRALNRIPAG